MEEQKYPRVTVGGLIVNPEGKVFLMKSPKWFGKYIIPGGHIELGESLEDALKRELKEETGLDVYDPEFITFHEFIFSPLFQKKYHFIGFNYACKTDTSAVRLNDEGSEFIWISPQEALKLSDINPHTKVTIEKYINRKNQG